MSTVRCTRDGRCGHLVLDRPPLNVLDLPMLEALDEALAGLEEDPSLQCLVVTGGGNRAFSAGVAVEDHVGDRIAPMLATFHRALKRLFRLPAYTLAAVDGHCLGGGLEVAAVCDVVLATPRSRFAVPEIRLGCYPPVAAALLPRRIGWDRALELMLTGRTLDAAEAERLGLVTAVVEDLDAAGRERLDALAAHSTVATRLTKRAALAAVRNDFERALDEAERLYLEELTASRDMHEGIQAFLERREPRWQHE
jgi:cyclohexa-1,5-dienecarbonyl-CoA hydratase